jgi:HEAT repeat protein
MDPLVELVSWPGPETRRGAVEVLGRLGDDHVLPILQSALSDSSLSVRRAAAAVLAMRGIESAAESAPSAPSGRELAQEAAGSGAEAWLGVLLDVGQPDESRAAAGQALAMAVVPDVIPLLVSLAQDPSHAARLVPILAQWLFAEPSAFATQDLMTMASWVGLPAEPGADAASPDVLGAFQAAVDAANEELSRRADPG